MENSISVKSYDLLRKLLTVFIFSFFVQVVSAESYTLDWSNYVGVDFSDGSVTFSNTDGSDTGINDSGVDVIVTITGEINETPEINSNQTGGLSNEHSLYLVLTGDYGASDSVNVSVSFVSSADPTQAVEVTNVSFDLFDVDQSVSEAGYWSGRRKNRTWVSYGYDEGHIDVVDRIQASNELTGDSNINPSSVDLTNESYLTYNPNGGGLVGQQNATSSQSVANAGISFGDEGLSEFQFEYGTGLSSDDDRWRAAIGLYDISFDVVSAPVVPEAGVCSSLVFVMGVVLVYRKRKLK